MFLGKENMAQLSRYFMSAQCTPVLLHKMAFQRFEVPLSACMYILMYIKKANLHPKPKKYLVIKNWNCLEPPFHFSGTKYGILHSLYISTFLALTSQKWRNSILLFN